ncbi:LCP family protein [Acetilactobacillus jinshanensis]|uniref:LytR family transcriptional regulator n=1 Tax=Acetilactobacillus jinshanensis TaxID=1720083 RepID=A0A4P6ZKK7_9LACO|nr:LCP family protein [Acetilactobacillus jinshanensis]QBP18276.1 LytR family transcriptional regulator [Acetilactobacillus jinshanensis]URL61140.1 LytR family transcriptional regulator [uncultured bacterium]
MLTREEYHSHDRQPFQQPNQTPQRPPHYFHRSHHSKIWYLVLIIIIAVCAFYLVEGIDSAKTFNRESYTPQNQSTTAQSQIDNHQPISVLMMGTDTGALGRHARGRTDTMIINSINPAKQTMSLTSIPRDAPAHYNNMLTKINSVYTLGGANQAAHYVQTWLGIPINYYMIINMGGLDKIIDKVGGVTVDPPLTFKYGAANVKKHQKVNLSGMQALDYCRMRHQDPLGDYGRQIRQRQVLFQLFDKLCQIHNLALHPSIANSLSDNMKTNLSVKDLMTLALFYRKANRHHVSSHLQGHTEMLEGQDFEVISPHEKAKEARLINNNLTNN